jgi:hypothetical protein
VLRRETSVSSAPSATDESAPVHASVRPALPDRAPAVSSGGSGSAGAPPLIYFFGLFAALAAAVALAAQRLSRWLRLSPDLCRPPLHIAVLERPG